MRSPDSEESSAPLFVLTVLAWVLLTRTFFAAGANVWFNAGNLGSFWPELLSDVCFGICAACALPVFAGVLRSFPIAAAASMRGRSALPYLVPFCGLAGYIILTDVADLETREAPPAYLLYSIPSACAFVAWALACDEVAKFLKSATLNSRRQRQSRFFLPTIIAGALFSMSMAILFWFIFSFFGWKDGTVTLYLLYCVLASLCVVPVALLARLWEEFASGFHLHASANIRGGGFPRVFLVLMAALVLLFALDVWDQLSDTPISLTSEVFIADGAYFLAMVIFCIGWSRAARNFRRSQPLAATGALNGAERRARWAAVLLVIATLTSVGMKFGAAALTPGMSWRVPSETRTFWVLWLALASVTLDLVAISHALRSQRMNTAPAVQEQLTQA